MAIENASLPEATLSASSLTFAPQALDTPSLDQTLTLTNTGVQTLIFTGIPTITGANAGDFSISGTNCIAGFVSMTTGTACIVTVNLSPQFVGTRTATLTFTERGRRTHSNCGVERHRRRHGADWLYHLSSAVWRHAESVYRAGSGAAGTRLPSGRCGAGGLSSGEFQRGRRYEYTIYAQSDGTGGYTLRLAYGTRVVPSPYLEMTASGNTVTLATPITAGTMQITSYRFALVGNEFQLDLGLARSGTFSDQMAILGQSSGGAYPVPYGAAVGQWSNLTTAGSTCNGASIATSIVVGDGAWQCWTATSQLGQPGSPVFGTPYWNGDSGDGNQSNIGWMMIGTGGQNVLPGTLPETLGYFGLPGGEESGNLYFASTGAAVIVKLPVALTDQSNFDTLGWYSVNPASPDTGPSASTMHSLVGPFTSGPRSATFQPTAYYGLYIVTRTGTFYTQPQFIPLTRYSISRYSNRRPTSITSEWRTRLRLKATSITTTWSSPLGSPPPPRITAA